MIVGGLYVRDLEENLHYMAVTRYDVRFYGMLYAGLRYSTISPHIDRNTQTNFASTLVVSSVVDSLDVLYVLSSRATGPNFDISLKKSTLVYM